MAGLSFYWHDYETWGADPSRDRPSQFAGIRTDADLNVIGEPLMLYCRPTMEYLPQPMACAVTGISPQKALEEGVDERAFMAAIHRELAEPGTCGAGYNSIRFDDEVTRYGLYRNFYDPYAREWQNGNSRWDLIDVVRLCCALRPQGIDWPLREDGTPSFKLEILTAANGIGHEAAHDALSDVYATIGLARLIREKQPKLFDYALGLRKKAAVSRLIDCVQQTPLLHISSRFPASRFCSALVMPLMPHPDNANSVIVYDLSVDPRPLLELSPQQIAERLFVATKDLPEGEARIALKEVHINKSPMLVTQNILDDAACDRLSIDLPQCQKNWQLLRSEQSKLNEKLTQLYAGREFDGVDDPDLNLYSGGFFSDADRQLMNRVRGADADSLGKEDWPFQDKRLPEMLFRYRARNFPDSLSSEEQLRWKQHCRRSVMGESELSSIDLAAFDKECDEWQASGDNKKLALLPDLRAWRDRCIAWVNE